ncbi:rho GTPase-activating protein gacZ-like, partial [Daktulosphaira vitifoliae]|uniref:rho GTPase-activating protein gacZ-like n=1 Tax=Daktulosphaira vitifoliae TaxID=58002 RepID=UPI0021AA5591
MNGQEKISNKTKTGSSADEYKDLKFRGIIIMKPESKEINTQNVFRIYEDKSTWVANDIQITDNSTAELQTNWKTLESQETYSSFNSITNSPFIKSNISSNSGQKENLAEQITKFLMWDDRKTQTDNVKTNKNPNESLFNISNSKEPHIDRSSGKFKYPLETSTSTMEIRVTPQINDTCPRIRSQPDLSHNDLVKNIDYQRQLRTMKPNKKENNPIHENCAMTCKKIIPKSNETFISIEQTLHEIENDDLHYHNVKETSMEHFDNSNQYNIEQNEGAPMDYEESFDENNNYDNNKLDQIYKSESKCKCKKLNNIKFTNSNEKYTENKQIGITNKDESHIDDCDYQYNDRKSDYSNEKETQRKMYLVAGEEKFVLNSSPSI